MVGQNFNNNKYILVGSTAFFLISAAAAFKRLPSPTTRSSMSSTAFAASSASPNPPTSVLSQAEAKSGKIWSRFADNYSKSPIKDQESYQKKLDITREYLTPQSKVLEFGCGTGGTAIIHAPYVKNILAIDLSSRMIEIAKEKAEAARVKNVKYECTGIDSFTPEQEASPSFDVILGLSVLHLLPNKDEIIQKVHQNLKPGGYFISSTACTGDFGRIFGWIISPFSWLGVIPTINLSTKQELLKSMKESGFQIEQEFQSDNSMAVFLVAKKIG